VAVLLLDRHLRVVVITAGIEIAAEVTETPTEAGICGNDGIHGATEEVLVGAGAMEIIGLVEDLVVIEVSF
jgi:hypothetical protein